MIFHACPLGAPELRVIGEVEKLKQNLQYAVSNVPRRWEGLLRRTAFARAIRGSNSIEGYNITVDDAIAAAEGEEPLEAGAETWAAIVGYRTAMTYILQLASDPHFRYSTDLVRSLHYMMIQHDLAKHPGRWRPGPIYVWDDAASRVVYEGPDAEVVPRLMDVLVGELERGREAGDPPMVRAAMAHLNLTMIHPFSDGNGRMARALQTLVLARTGTLAPVFSSIEEYLGRNTQEYYAVLATVGQGRWRPEADTRPWIRFCLTAHHRQAGTLLRRSREIARLWDLLEAEIASRDLPDRTIFALADAALGFRVRNATYRPVAEVSDQVASRDLKLLVDAGLLVPFGEKRGRFYAASAIIKQLRERTRESKPVEDPFVEHEPMLPGLETQT